MCEGEARGNNQPCKSWTMGMTFWLGTLFEVVPTLKVQIAMVRPRLRPSPFSSTERLSPMKATLESTSSQNGRCSAALLWVGGWAESNKLSSGSQVCENPMISRKHRRFCFWGRPKPPWGLSWGHPYCGGNTPAGVEHVGLRHLHPWAPSGGPENTRCGCPKW